MLKNIRVGINLSDRLDKQSAHLRYVDPGNCNVLLAYQLKAVEKQLINVSARCLEPILHVLLQEVKDRTQDAN